MRPTTQEPFHQLRILIMCEEDSDVAIWREVVRLPGCTVQVCHNYIEFLLYLEHESFELVMIFEGEGASPDYRTAAANLAEVHKDVSFQFIKRPVEETIRTETLECPN